MKANAPEKIYIQSFNVSEEDAKFARKLYFDDVWTEEPEPGQENIEYTRTDAFIEKAVKFLKDRVDIPYDIKTNEKGEPYADSYSEYALARLEAANKIIDEFKKYMEK